ncbi:hypothetical protein [Enterocloster asparagiformis]|uniref:BppU N-terminal domain-containing protein n=1 Tax=[Clostridium] asparagiforme DSM 15981 TaxID=518636 RepID=C0D6W4_9FIRM|nr:hypothetical protein [Enterocloster asparagiformis]EEG52951.1 hypothetical protein CLOSTASPAR_05011 [[Clostridium] asparagiforme DSM 15981]UWO77948.1 hypothetical protein NQ535_06565 [[Clostridium] asparagiforme DSM 15981]
MAEYNKQYTPTLWKNYPLTDTSINAYRLNHLEGGVNENDNRLVALSEDKAEQAVVNKMVKTVTLNKDTGVLTVTLLDGTQSTYDLDVEKVVANFDLNNNNDLVLTLADGTQKVVPLSKFMDTYTFKSSGTITFNANGKEITAFIPDGGITLAKLEATVLSTIRQYMLDAQTAKGQAEQAAENARGYAVGGAGFEGVSAQHFANQAKRYAVITDEAPRDNAQYYAQDAAKSAEEARQAAGCDGTAASISAVDVQGLVAAAGGTSDVQALINAVADQVINRLVAKGQIVNNLLATEPGNVLDATQGKALKEYYDRLNSDLTESKNEVLLYSGKIKYNDEISVPNLHKYKLFHLGDNQNELYGCDVGGVVGNVLEFNLSGQVSGRAVFSSIKFHIIKANTLKVIFNIQVNVTADNAIEYVSLERESQITLWGVPLI